MSCISKTCTLSHNPIPSSGPPNSFLLLVGEAPGQDEEVLFQFFVGKAGHELDNYLSMINIPRARCYITNILCCRPPHNRDPKPSEITACSHFLRDDILMTQPRVIATLGGYATRWFLGNVSMEQVHGIPFTYDGIIKSIVVPIYHPAAGLHDSTNMSKIMSDFQVLSQVVQGTLHPRQLTSIPTKYSELTGEDVTVIKKTVSASSPHIPQVGVNHELVAKYRQKKKELYLTDWIVQAGGINDPSLPGEIRDLVTGIGKGGRLKRAPGIPIGFLNKKSGKGFDILERDAREVGFQIADMDELLLLIEKDIRCKLAGDDQGRVVRPSVIQDQDVKYLQSLREDQHLRGIDEKTIIKDSEDAIIEHYQEDPDTSTTAAYDELSDFFTAKGDEIRSDAIDINALLGKVIAIDTETGADDKPWCLTFCSTPGEAYMVAATRERILEEINAYVSRSDVLTVLHNSLFDIPVLADMGVHPANIVDTMVMAYLLQTEPQGLKTLAYRHLGVSMRDYAEVVAPANINKAISYLNDVLAISWPDLEPVLEWEKGLPKIRKPQPLPKKVARLLNDFTKSPDSTDVRARWQSMDGRDMVEAKLGPMPEGYLSDIPRQEAKDYASADADITLQIYPILLDRIVSFDLMGVLLRDMAMIPMVADMQAVGIKVDVPYFQDLTIEFQHRLDDLGAEIDLMANDGLHTNPGSPIQALALIKRLTGKSVRSTHRDNLEPLRNTFSVVDRIIQWRGYDKLISTYLKVLVAKADASSRIHTSFKITRVVTGRLSSHKPNLLAQPVRTEDGRRVRGGFVSSNGCSLVSFDYSQIELRIMAHMSQDERMLNVFLTGGDIHTSTASEIWGVPLDQVDEKNQRRPAKSVNFGIIYGMTAVGLLRQIQSDGVSNWTYQMCDDFIAEWFRLYPGVKSFMELQKARARRYGLVRDIFNRMRLIPEVKSSIPRIVEEGLRKAINAPIQMGAQGVIKEAMGRLVPIYREYKDKGYIISPLIQIHDDLVWEFQDAVLDTAMPAIKSVMEKAVALRIPVVVDGKAGKRWNKMKNWNNEN